MDQTTGPDLASAVGFLLLVGFSVWLLFKFLTRKEDFLNDRDRRS